MSSHSTTSTNIRYGACIIKYGEKDAKEKKEKKAEKDIQKK